LTQEAETAEAPSAKGPMPPHARLTDILSREELKDLLAWAIANAQNFDQATVYFHGDEGGSQVDLEQRTALRLRDLGPFRQIFQKRLLDRLPEIMTSMGYRGTPPVSLEFELNAYGEGGHFRPHIDINTGPNREAMGERLGEDRVISAVFYFYREPKGFSGGALRLFRFGADTADPTPDDVISYEPEQNSLVVFPSWAWHQVEDVHCPSGCFADYRFALNCWFCRTIEA